MEKSNQNTSNEKIKNEANDEKQKNDSLLSRSNEKEEKNLNNIPSSMNYQNSEHKNNKSEAANIFK
jgi:hypothetical protein